MPPVLKLLFLIGGFAGLLLLTKVSLYYRKELRLRKDRKEMLSVTLSDLRAGAKMEYMPASDCFEYKFSGRCIKHWKFRTQENIELHDINGLRMRIALKDDLPEDGDEFDDLEQTELWAIQRIFERYEQQYRS